MTASQARLPTKLRLCTIFDSQSPMTFLYYTFCEAVPVTLCIYWAEKSSKALSYHDFSVTCKTRTFNDIQLWKTLRQLPMRPLWAPCSTWHHSAGPYEYHVAPFSRPLWVPCSMWHHSAGPCEYHVTPFSRPLWVPCSMRHHSAGPYEYHVACGIIQQALMSTM